MKASELFLENKTFLLFLECHLKYSLSQACVISKFSDTFIWPRCLAFADWVRFNLAKSPESAHNGHGAAGAAPRSGVIYTVLAGQPPGALAGSCSLPLGWVYAEAGR